MAKAKDETAEAMAATEQGMDQVRDILFGAQMRTVDRRLQQMENRFKRSLDTAQKDLSKKLANLDNRMAKQGEKLDGLIKAERSKRTEDLRALRSDMNSGFKDLEKSLASLDEATSKSDAELRDQMLAMGEALTSDIKALGERLNSDIDRYVDELRSEKTDISSLVELYSDMARRLAEILEGPAKK